MTKQTAVEWLIEKLEQKGELRETASINNIQLNIDTSDYLDLKIQAKEMEKERMIQFCIDWFISREMNIREYYNETYGGNDGKN
jgi:hypothetical protein